MPNVMQQLFIMNIESLLREYAAYKAFNKSDCVINMRIPHAVLDKIKELALEITKDLSVLVRMPYTCPKSRADQFVKDHLDWITVNLEKQRRSIHCLSLFYGLQRAFCGTVHLTVRKCFEGF